MTHQGAIQFDGANEDEVREWLRNRGRGHREFGVSTPDGFHVIQAGDWVEETDDGLGCQVMYVWTHEQWISNRFPAILEEWRSGEGLEK